MISYILILPLVISLLIVLFLMPVWIKKVKSIGLVWTDMNKIKSEKVAGSGGMIDVGLLFPLFFIPLGLLATTTTFNILAGFNGIEAGQGIILLSGLAFVAYLTSSPWITIICLCMILALIGFLKS